MIADELRRTLEEQARGFKLSRQHPDRLLRQARRRRARWLGGLAAVMVALGFVTSFVARVTPTPQAYANFTLVDQTTAAEHPGNHERPADHHGTHGDPMSQDRLQSHARCMRQHGVDVPDPVESSQGWTIPVKPSVIRSDVKAWREAFFVDCRLQDLDQNLVLGGRTRREIDDLIACARAKGFELPAPTVDSKGQYTFDLAKASPPWGSDDWYRTLFVTCAGSLPAP